MPKKPRLITDELLASWLKTLKPQTAKNYGVCLHRLLKEMGTDCKTLYEAAEKDPVGTWKKIKKTSQQIQSPKVRINACYAARRFLLDQDEDLMLPKSNLKQPDLVKEPAYLTWDEAQKVCDAASSPYNVAFKIMLSAGWGAGEFLQFNKTDTWNVVKAKLAAGQQSDYFRFGFKGRKKNQRPFYSLVPLKVLADAVALEAKGKIKLPLSYRAKNGKDGSGLDDSNIETNRCYLESAFRTALRRAPIIVSQGNPSLHELRDTFLTRAIQVDCSNSAANFVMGHVLDKLGYNKCFNDEGWLWSELRKIYGSAPVTVDEARKHGIIDFARLQGLSEEKLLKIEKAMDRTMSADEFMRYARAIMRPGGPWIDQPSPSSAQETPRGRRWKRKTGPKGRTARNGGTPLDAPYETRIVTEEELVPLLDHGWDVVRELASGKIIVRRPNDLDE